MESKWVRFEEADIEGRKTEVWFVFPVKSNVELGVVKWYGGWRCYAFYPEDMTIYEKQCLRDIAQFCEEETNKWRESKKKAVA